MKKVILVLFMAGLFANFANAQAFTKESWAGNLGFAFGWYGYGYNVSSFPAVTISLEKGVWDIEDVGVISLGATAGWKTAKYDWSWSGYSYDWRWTDYIIAARGAIHPVFIENEKIDLYGGLAIGVRLETWQYYDNWTATGDPQKVTENNTNGLFGLFIGGRYFFTDNFGVFSEVGYGLGYLTLGASLKF